MRFIRYYHAIISYNSIELSITHFLANEFIMPKVRQKLDDESFKFSLDCLDEIENILKMSGKEDENSQKMIQEARDTYQKFGFE